jgi:phosphoribosylformylglycinamidine cyclo-ligase
VDYRAWERPAIFELIQRLGQVPEDEMRKTFNLGIGLVAVVGRQDAERAESTLRAIGESPVRIGTVRSAT